MISPRPFLRSATIDDVEKVLSLARGFYQHFSYPWDDETKRKALLQLLDDPMAGQVWLVFLNEELVGYVILSYYFSLEYNGRTAVIDELYISPDYRGRGIGKETLQQICNFAGDHGLTALHLESELTNVRATALYKKLGFVSKGRMFMTRCLD